MKPNPRVVVTIAAYNEENNIGTVLAAMPAEVDVIVVDDGSKDNTPAVCRSYGAQVIKHPYNLGQGMGVITGFRACLMHHYDIIIAMDGDGQHDPQEIPLFVQKMIETDADIVIGSRKLGKNHSSAPFFRRKFLPYVNATINLASGYKMSDSMCGYRAFKAEALRRVSYIFEQINEPQYMSAELFIRFGRAGLTLAEVPVHLRDRISGKSYKGLVKYGIGVSRTVLRAFFSAQS